MYGQLLDKQSFFYIRLHDLLRMIFTQVFTLLYFCTTVGSVHPGQRVPVILSISLSLSLPLFLSLSLFLFAWYLHALKSPLLPSRFPISAPQQIVSAFWSYSRCTNTTRISSAILHYTVTTHHSLQHSITLLNLKPHQRRRHQAPATLSFPSSRCCQATTTP